MATRPPSPWPIAQPSKPWLGRPRRITQGAKEQAVVSATLRKPKAATHWSARRLAKEVGLSAATVHRIWQKYGLQPHPVETFKFSPDPEFDGKLADIVGLYVDPPERALVLCVDEKSQIQALNRTHGGTLVRPDYRSGHSAAAAPTAFDGWRPRSPPGSQPGTRTPKRFAGPSLPPISNAVSHMPHLFTRRDSR